jgi:hypothetical protein
MISGRLPDPGSDSGNSIFKRAGAGGEAGEKVSDIGCNYPGRRWRNRHSLVYV